MRSTKAPALWKYFSEALSNIPSIKDTRTLLVGGSVRDFLLSSEVGRDLDLVVEKCGGAEEVAKALSVHFGDKATEPHPLGQGYPIWQIVVKLPEDLSRDLGFDSVEVQIADTQKEMFPDPATRQRVTRFGNLEEDCARRDFTVNMLYWDFLHSEIIDVCQRGLQDLNLKKLAPHPKVDARKIFADDPLRMLRLLRFRAKLGFDVDEKLWSAFDSEFPRVSILSPERVRDEMTKCAAYGLADFFETLAARGVLGALFPELVPMLGCGQDKIYHSEGDVWVHTLLVMRNAPRSLTLQLAALLHDVGKAATREVVGERVKFLLHEKVSAEISRAWLSKWRFPKDLRERVVKLVELHLRGGDVVAWKSTKPARKLIKDAGEALEELLQLIEADSRSSLGPDGRARVDHLPLLRGAINEALKVPASKEAALSGKKIMEHFGVSEGPEVKRLKALAEDVREDMIVAGEEISEEKILQKVAVRRNIE